MAALSPIIIRYLVHETITGQRQGPDKKENRKEKETCRLATRSQGETTIRAKLHPKNNSSICMHSSCNHRVTNSKSMVRPTSHVNNCCSKKATLKHYSQVPSRKASNPKTRSRRHQCRGLSTLFFPLRCCSLQVSRTLRSKMYTMKVTIKGLSRSLRKTSERVSEKRCLQDELPYVNIA